MTMTSNAHARGCAFVVRTTRVALARSRSTTRIRATVDARARTKVWEATGRERASARRARTRTMTTTTTIAKTIERGRSHVLRARRRGDLGFTSRDAMEMEDYANGAAVAAPFGRAESDDLPSDLRDRTLSAIEKVGYKGTVGDVAAASGASVFETQRALNALAADAGAALEVSSDGDLSYVFPKSARVAIGAKSFKMRVEPIASGAKSLASYVFRVAFGTSLVASVMIVYTAIFALMSAKSSDDREGRRGGGGSFMGPRVYISPFDLFWYWDPYYYRRPRPRDREMNFFESVFSFVFGDGDPNLMFEKRRWELIGRMIKRNKGVVTAEQLAPYLDAVGYDDESFVLPALTRFQGTPEVNSVSGSIIYRFPSMETTAGGRATQSSRDRGESDALAQEERWAFSLADPSQKVQAALLGVANFVGVIVLSNMINDPSLMYRPPDYIALARSFAGLLPWLQAYGVLFFVVPAVRFMRNQSKNKAIDERNSSRLLAARRVASPEPRLAAKLAAAQNAARQRVVSDVIFTTESGGADDFDAREFDRRLKAKK